MITFLHTLGVVAAWSGLFYKLRALRQNPRDPALAALCAVFALSGLSFFVSLPPVWVRVDELTGVPNIAAVLAQSCVLSLVVGQQVVLTYWARPPERARRIVRWQLAFCAASLVALVTLFCLLTPTVQRVKGFTLYYVHDPYYVAYLSLYVGVYLIGEANVFRVCWGYSRVAGRTWLRRGLRVIAVGAFATLGYGLIRAGNVLGTVFDFDLRAWENVAWLCGDLGSALTLVGWTLPGWGPRVAAAGHWLTAYRRHRRLYPLWAALHEAVPTIALAPARGAFADRLEFRQLEFRLYRRVIEIRDGQLALRDRHDPVAAEKAREEAVAAGLPESEVRARVEAVRIRTALANKARGRAGAASAGTSADRAAARRDLAEETVWLVHVATAFAALPGNAAEPADSGGARTGGVQVEPVPQQSADAN
ncbi:MAB_1171c family putative transporter [Streptomyces sp. NPDC053048]|uniref:MAB_1171c family putative transporter n=1 Tax=Streptomyces sp. NPDC053048 TaxID=3365694 RepID=UPI0037D8FA8F